MIQTPYRYDFVGSFLRPDVLKQARKDWKANKISAEKLKEIEDEQIRLLIQKQKAAGFHVLTDGNSVVKLGIWILCGDLKELPIKLPRQVYHSMVKPL